MQETILIVGGTSGLGKRLAEKYEAEGFKVGIIGRRQHLLNEIREQSSILTYKLDISKPESIPLVETILNELDPIAKIIIAASIVDFNPTLSFDIEEKTLSVNVLGYAAVLNAAYHYFSKQGKGHIVGITSVAAARGNKTAPAYNASKAFQTSYLEGLRLKLLKENRNIYVTEIVPGYMDTQMAKGDRLFWMTSLEKATRLTKKAIDGKKRKAFISKRWMIVYKLYKFLPSFLYTHLINSGIKLKQKN